MTLGDLARKTGTDAAIGVDDLDRAADAAMAFDRCHQFRVGQQLVFEDRAVAMGHSTVLQPTAIVGTLDRRQQA